MRRFLVLPLTIPVYCLRTTPRHVTEFIRGHVYWPCSVNSCACANSVYQALLSPPLEPGNEASTYHDNDTLIINKAVNTACLAGFFLNKAVQKWQMLGINRIIQFKALESACISCPRCSREVLQAFLAVIA